MPTALIVLIRQLSLLQTPDLNLGLTEAQTVSHIFIHTAPSPVTKTLSQRARVCRASHPLPGGPFLSFFLSTHHIPPLFPFFRFSALSHLSKVIYSRLSGQWTLRTGTYKNEPECSLMVNMQLLWKSVWKNASNNHTSSLFFLFIALSLTLQSHTFIYSQLHIGTETNDRFAPLQLYNNCFGILANSLCLLSLSMGYVIVYFHRECL